MEEQIKKLSESLGLDRIKINEPMNRHTTFRIGGPADVYFEAQTAEEVAKAVKICRDLNVSYFVLGMGANLLVGDGGIRGLVIRPLMDMMEISGPYSSPENWSKAGSDEHYKSYDEDQYLKFDDLDLVEPPSDTLIRVGAGISLPVLISWTLEQNLTGLQNFAGIPSSVGGCLYNNVHGGTHLFNEFVHEVKLIDQNGHVVLVSHDKMGFAYDRSRLQKTHEIVLEVILKLSHGDIEKARQVRLEWLRRKLKVQPQKDCPGCVFKNISSAEAQRISAPTVAAGWVIDQGLGLKGTQIGGVKISEKHANFFINTGTATARDVIQTINLVKTKAKEKFNLDLVEEIQMVGEF